MHKNSELSTWAGLGREKGKVRTGRGGGRGGGVLGNEEEGRRMEREVLNSKDGKGSVERLKIEGKGKEN